MSERKSIQQGETLLKVDHLCQYFKSNKAVDDVSFEIKKGEVFGLVGESGCGKTTTGRSIIKLYDITSGSIYFKGERIAAGTLSYKQNIKEARQKLKTEADNGKKAELECSAGSITVTYWEESESPGVYQGSADGNCIRQKGP